MEEDAPRAAPAPEGIEAPPPSMPVLVEAPGVRADLGLAHGTPESPGPRETHLASVPSHRVPPGFRGPIPRDGDAEDTMPAPSWTPMCADASLGTTPHLPMNKGGWRYMAAGPAAQMLPTTVYRTLDIAPACVHWSWQDRSAFTRISADAMVVGTDKGYRSARTNVGVRQGAWYVELEVLPPDASSEPPVPMRDGPHVRVGWGRREASLNAPVGWDAYSYGLRDQTGACVTQSRLAPLGRAFGPGDVVGLYIRLPPHDAALRPGTERRIAQKRIPIRYRGQLYFESLEYAPTRAMEALMEQQRRGGLGWDAHAAPPDEKRARPSRAPAPHDTQRPAPPTLPDSCIGFVVNGEPQGIAFADLFDFRPPVARTKKKKEEISTYASVSTILKSRQNEYDDGMLGYYVMASMYGGARVRLRADTFRYPPPADLEDALWRAGAAPGVERAQQKAAPAWRPLAERYAEWCSEAAALDRDDDALAASAAS
ncbi:Similar to S.cerevisiae protein BRE2 (Subunit of COMPASS (Set1C) complex) [Malassezia sympodialis ATCC 42132]|uniref:Similar to S.cerevisiae protein BRE2 (Subunit of COMPASS (Set1C) complex) n=1 Tax=Malassezia sympodialis (strain ATCC 42132) TaxID=1230383 RepID=A0A1M8A5W8_MALS4|nr:Similar to S.cerevisiae protein BRE2 (Subunit of COMPASS (Set1C) complex) [Malassezia sympodialis ATCC 42132]